MKRFEGQPEESVPDGSAEGITEIELSPSNQIWGRDKDRDLLRRVEFMFECYLARTEVKEELGIAQRFSEKGGEWRAILDTLEMQLAFQNYLLNHKPQDIEAMRDMEKLLVEFRKVAGETLQ